MKDELSHVRLNLPGWITGLYLGLGLALIPWTVMLSYSLPSRHLSHNWDLAWAGFDIAILTTAVLTGYLSFKRSGWVCLTAMSVFTLLVVDAWFDVLTSRPGRQLDQALFMAVVLELPLALLSFWLSYRVARQLVKSHAHEI
jgi:hypothetical protein